MDTYTQIAYIFLMMLSEAAHISKFTVPHTLPTQTVEAFSKTVSAHKPKAAKGNKSKKSKAIKSKKIKA